MAGITWNGFDDGLAGLIAHGWQPTTLLNTFNTTSSGRTGSALGAGGTNADNGAKFLIPSGMEDSTLILGFALKVPTGFSGSVAQFLSDTGATFHVSLTYDTAGTITAKRGNESGTTLGSTSTGALVSNAWQYVEIKVTLSDTVGVVIVKVNGTTVLNLSSVDTKNAGTKTTLDAVILGRAGGSAAVNNFDDLYLFNTSGSVRNDFLGDCRVQTGYPSAAGSQNDFSNSASSAGTNNWSMVKETGTPNTTDYVQDNVSGHRDLYAMQDLPASATVVHGVAVSTYAQNTDSITASLKTDIKTGGTVSAGPAYTPGVSQWAVNRRQLEQNPVTGADWTVSDVNALEIGVEVV